MMQPIIPEPRSAFRDWIYIRPASWGGLSVSLSESYYGSPGMRANQLERRAVAKAGRRARNGRAWAAFNGG